MGSCPKSKNCLSVCQGGVKPDVKCSKGRRAANFDRADQYGAGFALPPAGIEPRQECLRGPGKTHSFPISGGNAAWLSHPTPKQWWHLWQAATRHRIFSRLQHDTAYGPCGHCQSDQLTNRMCCCHLRPLRLRRIGRAEATFQLLDSDMWLS